MGKSLSLMTRPKHPDSDFKANGNDMEQITVAKER